MWTIAADPSTGGRYIRFCVQFGARSATVEEVVNAWQHDASFRELFDRTLVDAPYSAFRWETPAASADSLSNPFEFVLLDSPDLERRPEPHAFAEHFRVAGQLVTTFQNLGGDATLVVPYPVANAAAYGHLAAFMRQAPALQRDALWQAVGEAMAKRIGPKPVWLSTAGAGVAWLHVRLDDRPKYYGYAPYRSLPAR